MSKPDDDSMQILKTSTCKTLSGKSTLTYQVGCSTEGDIHLHIQKNSGGGFFSHEWVAWKDIQTVIEKRTKHQNVTSFLLEPLYKGKSVNTPAFLLAALAHECQFSPI